jgi:hypothetical protein
MSYFTDDEIRYTLEALGIEHHVVDFARLSAYCSIFGYLNRKADGTMESPLEALTNHLETWVSNADEYIYAEGMEDGAQFAEYYFENYVTDAQIPSWLCIDWQLSWEKELRHDFSYDFDLGYVFAEH